MVKKYIFQFYLIAYTDLNKNKIIKKIKNIKEKKSVNWKI